MPTTTIRCIFTHHLWSPKSEWGTDQQRRHLSSTTGVSNAQTLAGISMKIKVTLYVAGKVFTEAVEARDYQDAKQTALARNPTAKAVSVTGVFEK